ncbi:unnamed protein product [Arctogadus glacialis]
MPLIDSRSKGVLPPGKLRFLFGSMTSFSILTRRSRRSSFSDIFSLAFSPPEGRASGGLVPNPWIADWHHVSLGEPSIRVLRPNGSA